MEGPLHGVTKVAQGSDRGVEKWRGGPSVFKRLGETDVVLQHPAVCLGKRLLRKSSLPPAPKTYRNTRDREELFLHTLFAGRGTDCGVALGGPVWTLPGVTLPYPSTALTAVCVGVPWGPGKGPRNRHAGASGGL